LRRSVVPDGVLQYGLEPAGLDRLLNLHHLHVVREKVLKPFLKALNASAGPFNDGLPGIKIKRSEQKMLRGKLLVAPVLGLVECGHQYAVYFTVNFHKNIPI